MNIAVVDGQGGGIGRAIVEKLREAFPQVNVLALGTNSLATNLMMRAGAQEGATGENAIIHNLPQVDIVCGVVAILNANSMMGELTPKMAEAIGSSKAYKVLLPLNRCNINIVSVEEASMGKHIENMIEVVRTYIEGKA